MELTTQFGKLLRKLRLEAGLTQESLAFEADLRRTYISILELGEQQPSLATIFKLAKALNIRPSKFIEHLEKTIIK